MILSPEVFTLCIDDDENGIDFYYGIAIGASRDCHSRWGS